MHKQLCRNNFARLLRQNCGKTAPRPALRSAALLRNTAENPRGIRKKFPALIRSAAPTLSLICGRRPGFALRPLQSSAPSSRCSQI